MLDNHKRNLIDCVEAIKRNKAYYYSHIKRNYAEYVEINYLYDILMRILRAYIIKEAKDDDKIHEETNKKKVI